MDVLLVAEAGAARDRYLQLLDGFGARVRVAADPVAVFSCLRDGEFSGIVFDEPTLLRDGHYDMTLLRGLCERYPTLHVMFDADAGVLHVLGSRHHGSSRQGFLDFLGECRDFSPQGLRTGQRRDALLPVLLSRDFAIVEAGVETTVTLNLSRHGCFVYTVAAWERGEQVWLVFDDVDPRPVRARVAWRQAWGSRRSPGLGLRFFEPHEALLKEIDQLEAIGAER